MRKAATVVVVTGLAVMVFAGIQPSGAQDPQGAEAIGVYHRLGSDDDLTSVHVTWNEGVMEVEGPALTDKLQVETAFLEKELGSWGSHEEFSVIDGVVEIDARKATFEAFHLGEEPIFTNGAGGQVKLLDRPMWLNASQEAHGERITLTMEDGDSSGQQVFISREWLWGHGIQWFNVTHEDGTVLPVTEQSGGVIVDVPHFSEVYINSDGLDVKQVVAGATVSNQGETRWFWQESVLEVDVDYNPEQDYKVLISVDWTELHIRPHTFNVYSSGDLVDKPDTGISVCCGGSGSSQEYYSVKFSTSGLSVRIEVIGEHLPIYTVEDDELQPHWGEKRWNETDTVLEVDVEDQSSDYEVSVEKDWANQTFGTLLVDSYSWWEVEFEEVDYYVVLVESGQSPTTVVFYAWEYVPWQSHEFQLDLNDLQDKVDQGMRVTLPLKPDMNLTVAFEAEALQTEIVVVNATGEEQNLTGERLMFGGGPEVKSPGLLLTMHGLRGTLCFDGEMFEVNPIEEPDTEDGGVLTKSFWKGNPLGCPKSSGGGGSSSYPYNPPEPDETRDVHGEMFLDSSYVAAYSSFNNAAEHVIDAIWPPTVMWYEYTGNWKGTGVYREIDDLDFSDIGDDCGKAREIFSGFVNDNGYRQPDWPANANPFYTLITGYLDLPCTGVARAYGEDCSNCLSNVGRLSEIPDNINLGRDRDNDEDPGLNYRGKSSTDHLGVLIAQEVGHNWGEPDHSCIRVNGEYSAMADSGDCEAPWDLRRFWLSYGVSISDCDYSRERIISGTMEYDGEIGECAHT